jgi:catechol 2,3-dioxygenase-like lactoylglutathione lyase family enzyme
MKLRDADMPELSFLKQGVAQVAIVVEDLDKAVSTYWRRFGIGPWDIYTYGKPLVKSMTYHGEPADYKMRLGLSYMGDTRIELIEPLEGETVYDDFIEAHGYGVQHFGFLVDDMEEALAEAEAAGIEMIMDGAGFGLEGDGHYAYLDTESLVGFTIELIERPDKRVPPEQVYPSEG